MGTSDPMFGAIPDLPNPVFAITDTNATANIVLYAGTDDEMLKITRDGFYVRGVKVPQDEREAEAVYEAFRQWMSYMALTRNY